MSDRSDAAGPMQAAWRNLVEKGLKGRPFSDLVMQVPEGFAIEPLQLPAAPLPIDGRGATAWKRLQPIDHPDPDAAARLALAALNGGADGLVVVVASAPGARGFGVPATELPAVLRDILIDACPIRLETGADGPAIATRLAAEAKARRIDPALVDIAFGIDPLSAIAASGHGIAAWPQTEITVAALVNRLAQEGYRGPFLAADGRRAHEAGADAASELAFVLASAVAYLRLLANAGIGPDRIAGAIEAVLAADSDQFMTTAKFRAAHLALARIRTASGLPPAPVRIHGETSFRMTTRLDPPSNLIRAAIAAFAAGVGGADSLAVLPFTAPFGLAGPGPRRIALDTQSILAEEAQLGRVADPARGSGSIEALTLDLAGEAWRRFQAIEAAGGLPAALASGQIQRQIAAERTARLAGIAAGTIPIVGTNIFRAEQPRDLEVEAPFPDPAPGDPEECEPLRAIRASAMAESEAA